MSLWNDFVDFVDDTADSIGDAISDAWSAIKSNPIGAITSAVAMAYGIPPAWAGALGGAAGAAATGGNIVKAAITGGAMGYMGYQAADFAGAAVSPVFGGAAGTIASAAAGGAVAGVTGAILTGQDVLVAAKKGLVLGTIVGAGTSTYKLMTAQEAASSVPTDAIARANATSDPIGSLAQEMGWLDSASASTAASQAINTAKSDGTLKQYYADQIPDDVLAEARSQANPAKYVAEKMGWSMSGTQVGGIYKALNDYSVASTPADTFIKYIPEQPYIGPQETLTEVTGKSLPSWASKDGIVVQNTYGELGVYNPNTGYTISYDGSSQMGTPQNSVLNSGAYTPPAPVQQSVTPSEPVVPSTVTTSAVTPIQPTTGVSDLAYSIAGNNPNIDVNGVQQFLNEGYSVQQISNAVNNHPNGGWAGELLSEYPGQQTTAPTYDQYAQAPSNVVSDAGTGVSTETPFRVDVGGTPAYSDSPSQLKGPVPQGYELAPSTDLTGANYDAEINAWIRPTVVQPVQPTIVPPIVVPQTVTQPVTPQPQPSRIVTVTNPVTGQPMQVNTETGEVIKTTTPITTQPVQPSTTTQPAQPTKPTVVSSSTRTTYDGSTYRDDQYSDGTINSVLISGPVSTSGQVSTGGTTNTTPLTPPTQTVIPPGSGYVAPVETTTTTPTETTTTPTETTTTPTETDIDTTVTVPMVPPTGKDTTPTEDTTYGYFTLGAPMVPKLPKGLNPGWITNVPDFYHTTNPAQSHYYWGGHPYQPGTTFDPNLYNQVPNAPAQPWGATHYQTSATPEQILQAMGHYTPYYNAPVIPQ